MHCIPRYSNGFWTNSRRVHLSRSTALLSWASSSVKISVNGLVRLPSAKSSCKINQRCPPWAPRRRALLNFIFLLPPPSRLLSPNAIVPPPFYRALVSDFPSAKLGVYVATDGVVYRDDVRDIATGKRPRGEFGYWHHRPATRTSSDTHEESSHAEAEEARKLYQKSSQASAHPAEGEDGVFRSILILVSIRLGIDSVHPTYHPALKACFELPWFVGIAG